ncbi:MAG TPA: hypothetical protein VFB63_09375 [Bryobacteraceae bacterium]|nr:hypothetical protein [Bryobacteraceae bacterium]
MVDPRIRSILDRKIPLPAQPPLPQSVWIKTFAKNGDAVSDLPLKKVIYLRLIADWIVDCDQPGTYSVVKITAVGHAEASESYAQAVSLKRAVSVIENLKSSIDYETRQWGTVVRPLSQRIKFHPVAFGSVGNKRAVELIFERAPYVSPTTPPIFIMEETDKAMKYGKYRFPPPNQPKPNWWKLPVLVQKDEYREMVEHLRKKTILRFFDLKTIVDAMWDIAEGQAERNPNASAEERQKYTEEAAEKLAEAWAEFDRDLQKRTSNPPGDSDD